MVNRLCDCVRSLFVLLFLLFSVDLSHFRQQKHWKYTSKREIRGRKLTNIQGFSPLTFGSRCLHLYDVRVDHMVPLQRVLRDGLSFSGALREAVPRRRLDLHAADGGDGGLRGQWGVLWVFLPRFSFTVEQMYKLWRPWRDMSGEKKNWWGGENTLLRDLTEVSGYFFTPPPHPQPIIFFFPPHPYGSSVISTTARSLNPDSTFAGSAPSSCLVTEWGEWDVCSATCGLGMKRRERLVKMPPADGSICGAEVLEVEKCMMPECRKSQLGGDQEPVWHLLHAKSGEKGQTKKIASNCERDLFRNVTVTDMCCVCRHDPLHADSLVWVEWLQRDLRERNEDPTAHAEVPRGAGRLYRRARAGGEVHAARVS